MRRRKMCDGLERDPVVAMWLEQPEEEHPVEGERLARGWAESLGDRTRSEILMSMGAGGLLLLVMGGGLRVGWGGLAKLGWVAAAAVVGWSLVSLYWFRHRIWHGSGRQRDFAAAGLEYYRAELEQRSVHLRNAWLWHGPLFLACAILGALLAGSGIA